MKIIVKTILLFFLFLFASCTEGEKDKCTGNCTEEFRTISVNIEDAEGNPVALDSFKVTDLSSGNDLTREVNDFEFELMRERGYYPLFGDEYFQRYFMKEREINFKGFINDQEVVSKKFMVGVNCCHVYHTSGDLDIVL